MDGRLLIAVGALLLVSAAITVSLSLRAARRVPTLPSSGGLLRRIDAYTLQSGGTRRNDRSSVRIEIASDDPEPSMSIDSEHPNYEGVRRLADELLGSLQRGSERPERPVL